MKAWIFVDVIKQSLFPEFAGLIRVSLLWLQPGSVSKGQTHGETFTSYLQWSLARRVPQCET